MTTPMRFAPRLALLLVSGGPAAAHALRAEERAWDPAMLATWVLGVAAVAGAALYASRDERRGRRASSGPPLVATAERQTPAAARLELSARHAPLFLAGASGALLLLFYTRARLALAVLFALGGSAALAQVGTGPLWSALAAKLEPALGGGARVLYALLAVLAPAVGALWFVARAQAWVWPLQDLLCVALCVVCVDLARLSSLRAATALLAAALAYDVFFVYLSPLVFGANVMVDVASGRDRVSLAQQPRSADSEAHAALPMVLVVPLALSRGSALLGLGDVILPGLLAAFCARYDGCSGTPLARGFFCAATAAYAAGLLLANVMAIALRHVVAGQPALMYIVPLMLAGVLGLAQRKGELAEMWAGPPCLEIETSDTENEREREPLLQTPLDRA